MTTKDARHNTARNEKQYRASWEYHIRDLTTLALAADIPIEEHDLIRDALMGWLDRAASRQNFPELKEPLLPEDHPAQIDRS
jgi:hypothetical protein